MHEKKRGGKMVFDTVLPVVIAGVAAVMDLRTARVDNGWIVFCLSVGFVVRWMSQGLAGIGAFFTGSLFPMIVLGGLFILRMLGPGDIKLFCALGGMMGVRTVGKCILVSFFLGAGISLAILISNGSVCQRFQYFIQYIQELVRSGKSRPYYRRDMSLPENFHFTVPVFLSVVLYAGGVY